MVQILGQHKAVLNMRPMCSVDILVCSYCRYCRYSVSIVSVDI